MSDLRKIDPIIGLEDFFGKEVDYIYKAKEVDALVSRLEKERAYFKRLALHALSGWAMGISLANAYLPKGTRQKQIKYFMVFKKFENMHNIEKYKWRVGKNERNADNT